MVVLRKRWRWVVGVKGDLWRVSVGGVRWEATLGWRRRRRRRLWGGDDWPKEMGGCGSRREEECCWAEMLVNLKEEAWVEDEGGLNRGGVEDVEADEGNGRGGGCAVENFVFGEGRGVDGEVKNRIVCEVDGDGSVFCLSPAGDTPSSARLFDAIVSGCIPVIISDELELPFEGILDYSKIAVFISSNDAVQPGWLLTYLRSFGVAQLKEMQMNLAKYSRHFLYSHPAQPLGPEDLAWRMLSGKLVNIKLHTRRSQRVVKESRSLCFCDCKPANFSSSRPLS